MQFKVIYCWVFFISRSVIASSVRDASSAPITASVLAALLVLSFVLIYIIRPFGAMQFSTTTITKMRNYTTPNMPNMPDKPNEDNGTERCERTKIQPFIHNKLFCTISQLHSWVTSGYLWTVYATTMIILYKNTQTGYYEKYTRSFPLHVVRFHTSGHKTLWPQINITITNNTWYLHIFFVLVAEISLLIEIIDKSFIYMQYFRSLTKIWLVLKVLNNFFFFKYPKPSLKYSIVQDEVFKMVRDVRNNY